MKLANIRRHLDICLLAPIGFALLFSDTDNSALEFDEFHKDLWSDDGEASLEASFQTRLQYSSHMSDISGRTQ